MCLWSRSIWSAASDSDEAEGALPGGGVASGFRVCVRLLQSSSWRGLRWCRCSACSVCKCRCTGKLMLISSTYCSCDNIGYDSVNIVIDYNFNQLTAIGYSSGGVHPSFLSFSSCGEYGPSGLWDRKTGSEILAQNTEQRLWRYVMLINVTVICIPWRFYLSLYSFSLITGDKFILLPEDKSHDSPVFLAPMVSSWPQKHKKNMLPLLQRSPPDSSHLPQPPEDFEGREIGEHFLMIAWTMESLYITVIKVTNM